MPEIKTISTKKYYALAALVFALLLVIPNKSYSQGRDRSKFQLLIDTGFVAIDTNVISDTTRIRGPVDSTARVKNFKFEREDKPVTSLGDKIHPLLLGRSASVEYKLTFDSLNNAVISEYFDGEQIKVPLVLSLDKYIAQRTKIENRNQLYTILADFYKIESEDELAKLFKNITEITIPLPFASETIFGPPTINLKINGVIDITASYQKTVNEQQTITQTSSDQNNINFKQEVQVTTKGSVGDKLTIDADWNSQRTFDFENQLKLKYQGYPDEVIQAIEAGNVSLETKSNLIGGTQALFGVKAQFKLGPLSLTAIASQKKSEKKEVNISGGTVETPFNIPIWDYSENNYLLDESYESSFIRFYRNLQPDINITRVEVWVVSTVNNPKRRSVIAFDTLGNRPQGGYTGLDSIQQGVDGKILIGNFYKLESTEYTLNQYAGYITLNGNLQQTGSDAICVAYSVDSGGTTKYVGDFSEQSTQGRIKLKMLRTNSQQSPSQNPNHAKLWKRMLKNIYSLGVRNLNRDPSSIPEMDIYYNPPGITPEKTYTGPVKPNKNISGRNYMNLTGVDYRVNGDPNPTNPGGDGKFDFFPGNTIDLLNGNVIFPTMRPFSRTLDSLGVDTSYIGNNDSIYTTSKSSVQQYGDIKFAIVGKAKGEASSRYSLGFNVVEGSVKVFNGTVELQNGVDYTIDYSLGELVITNAAVLVTGSNIKITYESNDLFTLASKTLLGTRAELNINKTSYIGFTLVNLKQQTLNDKVRIGEEPTNNTIMGFDASTDIKANFLTKLINKIPGYYTKDESILNLKGEVAFMLPDPNTKKSVIPSDNNEAVAYIDDFEGVKKVIPLSLNPLQWTLSSVPIDEQLASITQTDRDSIVGSYRSKLVWFSDLNAVPIKTVYPNKSTASNQNQNLSPLGFDIIPDSAGQYNFKTTQVFQSTPKEKKWSGVFRYLNTSQSNFVDENINYIEIWMKVQGAPSYIGDSAKMLIDLGEVSEKIITATHIFPPKQILSQSVNYHTEDLNGSGFLDAGEDVGIDGYNSKPENGKGNEELQQLQLFGIQTDNPTDPSRDDYSWTQNSSNFSSFNGSEYNGSQLTEAKRVDTEDLNNNGTLDENNKYFEYEIPLTHLTFGEHPFIAGGGNEGWYQFVVPLDQFKRTFGDPSLTYVQYVRVWFKGFSAPAKIRIVDFNLVGNQWVKLDKKDTSYTTSLVNIEDNSAIYQSPVPGNVLRQKDPNQPDQNVLSNEQSLSLDMTGVLPGQSKIVFKSYVTRPYDLINYKILKLFVNGDTSFVYKNPNQHDATMIVRIGSDTSNYYEYRAPIHPDVRNPKQNPNYYWNSLNEVSINLNELTAVKQKQDSLGNLVYQDVVNGPPGAKYGVKGHPSIRDVKQIALGVYNSNTNPITAEPLNGSIWFDELRVLKTNDANGYAYTFSAGLKLADFGTFNFSYSKTDPNFHNLEGRFGGLNLANSWELSGTVNLHKLLNALLAKYVSVKLKNFFTIPVSFGHTESLDKPEYQPSTDVDVETAANNKYTEILNSNPGNTQLAQYEADKVRINSQTLRIVNRFSITGMKFNFPVDNFFVNEILNKIEVNFTRNTYTERTPSLESRYAWDMNGGIGISSNINLWSKLNLSIGKWLPMGEEFKEAKIYFFFPFLPLTPFFSPTMGVNAGFTRSRGDEKLRTSFNQSPTSRNFAASRSFSLDWKFIENWMIDVDGNYSFTSGSDLTYLETTEDSAKQQRPDSEIYKDIFFHGGIINWGKDLDFAQNVAINPKFNIPGLRNFVDLTASYRVQYGWRRSEFSEQFGSTAGYSADLQSTAFLKLIEFFNLFGKKDTEKNEGGGYQDDGQQAGDILKLIRSLIPDQVTANFAQTKQLTNPAVSGQPGLANFWMNFKAKDDNGPSRIYQLGWQTDPGKRVPNVQFTDLHNLNNIWTFNTFITPIFPNNLKINFTYKTSIAKAKQLSYITDSVGSMGQPISTNETRTLTRPSFFVTGDVISKIGVPDNADVQAKYISDSFEKNFVSFPFPSWTLNLTGVEKFDLFSGFAQTMTIESGYSSEYKKIFTYDGRNPEIISSLALTSSLSPLIGININFKPISEGTMTASFKLGKSDNYNIEPNNTARITNTASSDFSINASYTKAGFKIPLFGLALDNNLTVGFSYTRTKNEPTVYELNVLQGIWTQNAQSGSTTTTTLNPSIQYNLSSSVVLQLFYKYNKIEPTGGNLQITTRTSNEAGLNIKLQIQ